MRGLTMVLALVLLRVSLAQAKNAKLGAVATPQGNQGIGFGHRIAGTWLGVGWLDLDIDYDGIADVRA